ncbi:MAG: CCA tRNA nucleotidyltransferase, partial [Bacteroidales bacterium]|nr:CCA tRNA nucleotidyltransferase [Bacteroidales bacterium]
MSKEKDIIQSLSNPLFRLISEAADELSLETYVVGGFVRDLLLNKPSKDIDIVTIGSGITLARHVAEKAGKKNRLKVYGRFGTAMIHHNNYAIEFVGARKESYQKDSRKPIVEDGTLKDDQNRRDFSINAMAIRLNKSFFGQITDPFDGRQDLINGIIRTPLDPDITFSDDPLRILRAIRFAATLHFKIEETTFIGIKKQVRRLEIVSAERIADELNKIIAAEKPSYGITLMDESDVLQQLLPELCKLKGVEKINNIGHKDNFLHTLEVLDNVARQSDNIWLRWAA